MKQAILFDLDGTLWDSSEQVAASWREALENGFPDISVRPTGETLRRLMGKTLPDIGQALFPMAAQARAVEAIEACCAYENIYLQTHTAPLYDDVENAFADLARDYALCIVSNCQEGYIEAFLHGHPELKPYISDTENAGRTGLPKWDNIRLVCTRNDFEKAIYVGDTLWDQEAAKRAGLPFLHAAYGFGKVPDAPAVCKIYELPAAARALLK
ncbi:MAG: HAD family hydrolase [Clostridiaceae bacterium]|nr:HAD family hydrolase [Clostridiaceae bacterium]